MDKQQTGSSILQIPQIFRETNASYLISKCKCTYQKVKNISFTENLRTY